ncbi:hypothetical protein kam1_1862 [Methylacidiphilum kamchatkense Kam1]|uniref:Uncharacterized protein n=1 Tax=Methylacidiphilum kamchatkense Kam1 TaxID=1202785 RepID=A0A516TPE0_9BACT|nr:hypothetical protein kam1_1862 [Methylacidiphilum kamchatkense Kam1]
MMALIFRETFPLTLWHIIRDWILEGNSTHSMAVSSYHSYTLALKVKGPIG